jgi:hypothetical protein
VEEGRKHSASLMQPIRICEHMAIYAWFSGIG